VTRSGTRGSRGLLPLAGMGSQPDHIRCRSACGDDCGRDAPNTSGNETFAQVIERGLSRRRFLQAGAASALVLSTLTAPLAGTADAQTPGRPGGPPPGRPRPGGRGGTLGFAPIEPNRDDQVTVPTGYEVDVLIRWGDPVLPGAPAYDFDAQTAAGQALQFGYNNDYVAFFPMLGNSAKRGILGVNHEYTDEAAMFRGYDAANPTREQVDIGIAAHGLSFIEVAQRPGRRGRYTYDPRGAVNRRITGETLMELTGPAAGAPGLRTSEDPEGRTVRGTYNNCAGGTTPWGTYLTAEENFNQYFANANAVTDPTQRADLARYGLPGGASQRKWERFHPRFDIAQEPNEPNRHGWIVEVDPYDPTFVPRKRSALGRMKHEGGEPQLARDGRVVVYMGDDEIFDYFYKFVSAERYRPGDREHNLTLLDEGTLYVAKLDTAEDGSFTGEWLPLVWGTGLLTAENGFVDQADVLIRTRQAADALGATAMDRPEDVEPNPATGSIYVLLTNNTARTAAQTDAANPRGPNRFGHVIEVRETGNDAAAETFDWEILLLCGDPDSPDTYFAGYPKDQVSPIGSPDNCAFDAAGNLWLATDGTQPRSVDGLPTTDGFFACPVEGPERGHVQMFLSVPPGAEACGICFSPDQTAVFCAVQHPGGGLPVEATISSFPDGPGNPPRPSLVGVWRAAPGEQRIGR